MSTLAKLFGRSPFAPLRHHMEKVRACTDRLPKLFAAIKAGDMELIEKLSAEISKAEHEADLTKNNLRNNLPYGIFLPVDRGNLLEILSLQDSIADKSEDIGVVATFAKLPFPAGLEPLFDAFAGKNLEAVAVVEAIMAEMDKLLEASFGGSEAERIKKMVDEVAYKEHECDLSRRVLLKWFFANEDAFTKGAFILWLRLLNEVGALGDYSEKLANRVRMTLDPK